MSYKLIKNQLGGADYTIFIVIAVIVALWFFFSKSKKSETKKEEKKEKVTEKYSQYMPSMMSSPESTASDLLNFKTRPAVDLKSPGVPYFAIPARLAAFKLERSIAKKSAKKAAKKAARKLAKRLSRDSSRSASSVRSAPSVRSVSSVRSVPLSAKSSAKSTPVSSPKSSPVSSVRSTPVSSAKSSPVSSAKSTPVSSARSTPVSSAKSTPVSSAKSTPVSSARSSPIVVPKSIPLLKKNSKKVVEKMTDVNNLYSVRDSYDLKTPLSKSVCSQKCCGYYWKGDNMDEMFKKNDPVKWDDVGAGRKFRTSNVTCMGDGVAPPGCRCYSGDQQNLLATRGGNGSKEY